LHKKKRKLGYFDSLAFSAFNVSLKSFFRAFDILVKGFHPSASTASRAFANACCCIFCAAVFLFFLAFGFGFLAEGFLLGLVFLVFFLGAVPSRLRVAHAFLAASLLLFLGLGLAPRSRVALALFFLRVSAAFLAAFCLLVSPNLFTVKEIC